MNFDDDKLVKMVCKDYIFLSSKPESSFLILLKKYRPAVIERVEKLLCLI